MTNMDLCLPPHSAVNSLEFSVPPYSCDCHAHIIGPVTLFPQIEDRSYSSPEASLESYQTLHRELGIRRAIIVQPSIYGYDNRVTINAISRYGATSARGIAVVTPQILDSELETLHLGGIRGVRFNLLFKGGASLEDLEYIAQKIAGFKWHIQLLIDVSQLEAIASRLRKLPVPVIFDHMGHMPTNLGVQHSGFQTLINLMKEGCAWAKVSGNYRISSAGPPYRDAIPFAQALIAASPDRVVWGTDWPHPGLYKKMPNDGDLLGALDDYAPSSKLKQKILVDNPEKLYGFDTQPLENKYER